jgi:hypothetical protein
MSTGDLAGSFRGLPELDRVRANEFTGVKNRSFYGLLVAHELGFERVSATNLSVALDAIGVSLSSEQIRKALAAAKGQVSIRHEKGAATYRLMQDGYKYLDELAAGVSVTRIEGGKPLTARQNLAEALGQLAGIVRISDPYYGQRTVSVLAEMQRAKEVRFLTHKVGGGESGAAVKGAMRDLMREMPAVSIRVVLAASTISHDRFVLTDDDLILIGHGLKDLGARDSFLIRLPNEFVKGITEEITRAFDDQWSHAGPI